MYELYKRKDSIEKLFDAYKTTIEADKLYLHDDESVYGHVFVAFLSLYAYCKILKALKKADINNKFSPTDILLKFRKVKNIDFGEKNVITEVPKKVRELDKTLKFNIFPTKKWELRSIIRTIFVPAKNCEKSISEVITMPQNNNRFKII